MTRKTITETTVMDMYDTMIDEAHDRVFNIPVSYILQELDHELYRRGLNNYYKSIRKDYYCMQIWGEPTSAHIATNKKRYEAIRNASEIVLTAPFPETMDVSCYNDEIENFIGEYVCELFEDWAENNIYEHILNIANLFLNLTK